MYLIRSVECLLYRYVCVFACACMCMFQGLIGNQGEAFTEQTHYDVTESDMALHRKYTVRGQPAIHNTSDSVIVF